MFENLPDFVIILDRDATIRYVNHGSPDATVEMLIGAHGFSFLHESSLPQCREAFAKALSSNTVQQVDALDNLETIGIRIVPIVMEKTMDHVMIICTDTTAEKLAAEAVRKEQILLHNSSTCKSGTKISFLRNPDGFAQQITAALFHLEAFRKLPRAIPFRPKGTSTRPPSFSATASTRRGSSSAGCGRRSSTKRGSSPPSNT